MSVIDDVKQKTDIVEVIGQFTTLKKAGRTYRGLCPFHSEKTPSFFVYPEQQTWHCFGACATGGDVFAFIMKKQGGTFGEALRFLAERAGVEIPVYNERPGEKDAKERIFEANREAALYYHEIFANAGSAQKARDYLKKRGLDLKTITQFQFGYAPDEWDALKQHMNAHGYSDKDLLAAGLVKETEKGRIYDQFRNKLMIPICDIKGRVTGFGGRVLEANESGPKYINSPQTLIFEKSGTLYGINFAAESIKKHDLVVIVEGYMDVVAAHQYGFTNVVASMGTAITEKQINILKRLTRNVSLALDPDAAGEEAMLRGVNYENTLDSEVKVVLLPEGKDPDEVIKEDKENWVKLVNAGTPVVDYTFASVISGLNLSSVKDKTIAVDRLLPVVKGIGNDIRRDHYLNKLAEMTGTTYRSMELALGKLKTVEFKAAAPSKESAAKILSSLLRSPQEEHMLCLLMRHPELHSSTEGFPAEYFENSENRELFSVWQANSDIDELRQKLDNALQEHFELILGRRMVGKKIEEAFRDCVSVLKMKYLRNLENKKAQVLAMIHEEKGTDAELAELVEQGTAISEHLKTEFDRRSQSRKG
jgi:DNA primase